MTNFKINNKIDNKICFRVRYNRANHSDLIKKCIAPFIFDSNNKNTFDNFFVTKNFNRGASVLIFFSSKNNSSLNQLIDTAGNFFSDFVNRNPSENEESEINYKGKWFMNYPENTVQMLRESEMERYNSSQNFNVDFSKHLDILNTNFTECAIKTLRNIEGEDYQIILTTFYELLLSVVASFKLSKYESKSIFTSILSKISNGKLNVENPKVITTKLTSGDKRQKNQIEKDFQSNYENLYPFINKNWLNNIKNEGQNTNFDFINCLAIKNRKVIQNCNLSKKRLKIIIEHSILNFFKILNLKKYTYLFILYSLSKCLND